MPKLTMQEAVTKIITHLLTQGKRSALYERDRCISPNCRYRYEGLKCAIGALIPDNLYSHSLEGWPVECLSNVIDAIVESPNYDHLKNLQRIHDAMPVNEWREYLEDFCLAYRYQFPPTLTKEVAIA